jgi:oligopeptide/dipeptide ABC transporter ATP-binding protein
MKDLVDEFHMSILFITHDLGVIAQTADRVAVMYLGNLVETGTVRQVINTPAHPYTRGLLNSLPKLDDLDAPLTPVPGDIPSPLDRPETGGIAEKCRTQIPGYTTDSSNHQVACHLATQEDQS